MNISEFVRAEEEALEAKREAAAVQQGMEVAFNAPELPKGKYYDPSNSALVCGCDKGANHTCERHQTRAYKGSTGTIGAPVIGYDKPEMSIAHWDDKNSLAPSVDQAALLRKLAKGANALIGIGGAPTRATTLPADNKERKKYPVATGVLDYFPDAIVALSHVSWQGNEQHNPDQPLHWNRNKSADEADTAIRHFLERGTIDKDGIRHTAKWAWRALAYLQKEIEQEKV